jgi:multiple sugar transport system substrate-binding protein
MFEAEQYGNWIGGSWGYVTQALKRYYDLPSWKQDHRITPYRECAGRVLPNSYDGPLGKSSAAAMSEYIIVDMFADACAGKRTSKEAALAAEKKLARLYK